MDLTKVKLHSDPGCTYGGIPLYLLLSGSKKLLVTQPVLAKKRKDLYTAVREADPPLNTGVVIVRDSAYPLAKGGYLKTVRRQQVVKPVPKSATRIYRVHPNKLSEKQREKMAGPGEGGKYRAEFVEEGLTSDERQMRAREVAALASADYTRKESARKKERREKNRQRADYQSSGEEKEPKFEGVGVKEIAEQADLEATLVRRFLRAKKIGKRGGRYAFTDKEARKVVRAVVKHYAD